MADFSSQRASIDEKSVVLYPDVPNDLLSDVLQQSQIVKKIDH